MNESPQSPAAQSKTQTFAHRPIDKPSEGFQIKVRNGDSWRLLLAFLIPIGAAAILWWLSLRFVTLERYERERADDKVMQKEMRDDIKQILREVKK